MWYLITQSTSVESLSGSFSRWVITCSHIASACSSSGERPRRFANWSARVRYSDWISTAESSRPLASRTRRRQVMSWLISRMARIGILEREVAPRARVFFEHAQHDGRGADLEEGRVLAHVGVADDHVQPAEALGVGVRLVARVDDRTGPGGRARHAFPDVLGALAHAVHRAACGLQHLARTGVDLAGDEERDQHVGELREVAVALDEVVLVTAVRVARGVGVVLEQVDLAADAFLAEPLLGTAHEALEDTAPPPCRARRDRRWSRTRAWRTRGGCRRRGRGGHRSRGRRCSTGPRRPPGGTGSGRPRRGSGGAGHAACT